MLRLVLGRVRCKLAGSVETNIQLSKRQITALSHKLHDSFKKANTNLILAKDAEERVANLQEKYYAMQKAFGAAAAAAATITQQEKKRNLAVTKLRFDLAKQRVEACTLSLLSALKSDVQNKLSKVFDSSINVPLPDNETDMLKQGFAKLIASLTDEVMEISLRLNSALYELGVDTTAQPETSAISIIAASMADLKNRTASSPEAPWAV
jgi:hypothetical protein